MSEKAGRALTAVVLWVLGGFVALVFGGAIWWVVASSDSAERGRQDARASIVMTMNRTNADLREAIGDGELSEADVSLASGHPQELRSVRRDSDRVVITTSIEGRGPGWFGSTSVTQCAEYEITLPITAQTSVRQREVDSCPPTPS
ncbi:hypothetical protein SAMN05216188_102790 [Lentzea xinjiangensis]|uniref:Uncharacterized protein n=1 Tax=Lentzea xinjiangensis TaxID=402600 RepID=A0A1H9F5C7_9PSEU|nr:hypothetical protein [Lentzea xinjiangensis]SEQ33132.1 hypothetical protein SAMN05216188_102790 [Lentzea xinjiangensis]